MMKKVFVLMAALVLVSFAASAQSFDGRGFVAGARLGPGIGFHGNGKYMDDTMDWIKQLAQAFGTSISVDERGGLGFIIAGYGAYYFTGSLAVQAELNFMIGQKKIWELSESGAGSGELEGSYSSLDIPILLRYEFLQQPLTVGLVAGPVLSIPISDLEVSVSSYLRDVLGTDGHDKTDGITFGATAGVFGSYPLGPGKIIADLRFLLDFNPLKVKEDGITAEIIKRRSLNITVGYEFSF
jgi:hypothetical protein